MWNQTERSIGIVGVKMKSKYLQELNFYQIEAGNYTDTRKMVILK